MASIFGKKNFLPTNDNEKGNITNGINFPNAVGRLYMYICNKLASTVEQNSGKC